MRPSRFLIGLLIGTFALANISLWVGSRETHAEVPFLLYLGVLLTQVSLLAAWMAVGRGKLVFQIIAGGIGIAAAWEFLPIQENRQNFGLLLLGQSLIVFLVMMVARLAGYRLQSIQDVAVPSALERAWQFSLTDILQATTLAAVLAAIIVRFTVTATIAWEGAWLAAAFALLAPPLILAILLTDRRLRWGLIAAGTAIFGTSSLLFFVDADRAVVVALSVGQIGLIGLVLLIVRLAGYRLIRRTPAA